MLKFRRLSIKYKILSVVVLTTGLSLLLSYTGVFANDRAYQRDILGQEMQVLARVISARSAAALSFNDKVRATENISTLLFRNSVTNACIYDAFGRKFVHINADAANHGECPSAPAPEGAHFQSDYLDVVEPITLNGIKIGSLLVRTDLTELESRVMDQFLRNVAIGIVALLTALLVSARMQRAIYRPIVELGEVAHLVTHKNNYAIRATTDNEDELGETVRAFNSMLSKIERDKVRLTEMAYLDPLTELPNRRRFNEHLAEALEDARVRGYRVGVIFVDLDEFKQVNDQLGHDVGDLYLQAVAQRLQAALPENASAYRLAGDEFTVLLTGATDIMELEDIAKQVFHEMEPPFVWSQGSRQMKASLGLAFSRNSDTAQELVKRADTAVYQAKDAGRNTYRICRSTSRSELPPPAVAGPSRSGDGSGQSPDLKKKTLDDSGRQDVPNF